MKLSVVILNYNVSYFLELCLKSVIESISNLDSEIIVVDNNSKDGSSQMVKQLFPEVNLIENKENFGFSKGNNIGLAQAKGEYICILNPDTVVAADTFIKLLKFADEQQNLGMVGCKLIDGKGQFLPESKRNMPVVSVAIQKMLGNSSNYYANHLGENETGKIDVLVGAFILMKKDVYDEVNGFDEDYFMYGEDIDLSYKVLNANYTNYYYGQTTVIHFKGESTIKDKTYAKRFYRAMQIFYKKHFKKNMLVDFFVRLGLVLAYNIRSETKVFSNKSYEIETYIVLSNKKKETFIGILKGNIIIQSELQDVSHNSEVIFDTDYVAYKDIIKYMSNSEINSKVTFKIYPKNSNFILGSNNPGNRGEIIKFI